MAVLQWLGYVFEAIGFISGLIMAYFVIKQNPKYIGNKLMALSALGIAGYIGGIFLYDVIATERAIQILYRIAMPFILIGAISMYYTMQIMVHSSSWLRQTWKKIVPVLIIGAFTVYISIADVIEVNSLEVVDTTLDLFPLLFVSFWVLGLILASIIDLYLHGIRKMKGQSKKHMLIFMAGLIINLFALILTVISNLISNAEIAAIFDVLFFLVLAIGTGFMSFSFIQKARAVKSGKDEGVKV